MKPTDEKIIMTLQKDIELLRKFSIENDDVEITLDLARWIGDGSGTINDSVRFYIDNTKVFYLSNDADLLNFFNRVKLELKIIELVEKQRQIHEIINSYY
jgi:hypothetical protein